MRRQIKHIVIHCSATPPSMDIGAEEIRSWHVGRNGWRDIGYHYIIRRDGRQENGRDLDGDGDVLEHIGAGVYGFNRHSAHLCYIGGVNEHLEPEDNRTDCQKDQLLASLKYLKQKFPEAEILGHRDLSPDADGDGVLERHEWLKACPSFDAKTEYKDL